MKEHSTQILLLELEMETQALKILKLRFPQLRRQGSTAIVHSGSRQTVWRCLCGSEHTAASRYKDCAHVRDWERKHLNCAAKLAVQNVVPTYASGSFHSLQVIPCRNT